MYDIPELTKMPEELRARETERCLRELTGEIERTLIQMETKLKKIEKMIGEMRK